MRTRSQKIKPQALLVALAATWLAASGLSPAQPPAPKPAEVFTGFDRNQYPGDEKLDALRRHFSFAGYWLTNPPGETTNEWLGKRRLLLDHGFGFLVLANGRLDAEIKRAGKPAAALGTSDAATAVAAARREGFRSGTILFLDQEEGGELLPEQADYLFGWTEAVARSEFRPGAYVSGQPVSAGHGRMTSTALDLRHHVSAQHLRDVALWVYQDACPPAPGCTLKPPAMTGSGTPGAVVWQYAQSPRRPATTGSCRRTYAPDGNCRVTGPDASALQGIHLDLDVATSPDPSNGR